MIQQVWAVTLMNLRAIPQRLGASLVIVIGIAGVVGVLVALLSMARGFQATLNSTGRPDRVIVMRGGATDELSSVLFREQALIIQQAPGIRMGSDGRPLAVSEVYMLAGLPRKGQTEPANVVLRGTGPNVLQVRSEVKLVEGRMFRPGIYEVIVGRGARDQFAGMTLGGKLPLRDGDWTIVGFFDSGGDVHESELWADAETLMQAGKRGAPNSVTVQLESEQDFARFKDALTTDPRLNPGVQKEPEYYSSRSKALNGLINGLGYTVGVIMAIGALFGSLNTMYAAVSTRTVEIATLRALGFGGAPVLVSVMIEAMLLSLAGGLLGAAISYVVFNGYSVSTLNFQTFSQVAFAFRVTPDLLWQGVIWALLIGAVGGFFPALKAIRLPVVEALRSAG
ncbi:ABC transporter permease [Solimonas sp. K1W22B-7]|uniref:ABC transporter permease n=1 Tax=Solimonas sp. K1W22B-7 TaxID=2303331 RepID=UPI000E330148|nr:ABC transporter permease [Solimonas sp. K1W22B-7]AXQ27909.1 ABC transporter permease [Solimonas sp. K1W22B-7]